ncbi:hypothetical protein LTR97_000199 [Elasticomyces elasticus]|uniref:Uncharacterized protein n=1 Tax=Elasticomyces elasticus TaxID=574655 RepID=A0AAN7WIM2_9PEZI|nr:hypothetical protein LTR97_000199 [Elasticomyces elasticus]
MPLAGNAHNQAPQVPPAARRPIADFFLRTWLGNTLAVIGLLFTVLGVAWTIYTGVLGLRYGSLQTCATLYSIGKYSGYCNKTLDAGITPTPIMRRHSSGILFWRKNTWTAQDGYVVLYPDTPFWWQRLFDSSLHRHVSEPSLATLPTGWPGGIMWAAAVLIVAVAIFAVICRRPSLEVQRYAPFDVDHGDIVEYHEVIHQKWLVPEPVSKTTPQVQVLPTGSNDVPHSSEELEGDPLDPAMIAKLDLQAPQHRTWVRTTKKFKAEGNASRDWE